MKKRELGQILAVGILLGSILSAIWYWSYSRSIDSKLSAVCQALGPYLQIGSSRWAKDLGEVSLNVSNPELKLIVNLGHKVQMPGVHKVEPILKSACKVRGRESELFLIEVFPSSLFKNWLLTRVSIFLSCSILFCFFAFFLIRGIGRIVLSQVNKAIRIQLGAEENSSGSHIPIPIVRLISSISGIHDSKKVFGELRQKLGDEVDRTSNLQVELERRRFFAKYAHDIRAPIGALQIVLFKHKNAFNDAENSLVSQAFDRLKEIPNAVLDVERRKNSENLRIRDLIGLLEIVAERLQVLFGNSCRVECVTQGFHHEDQMDLGISLSLSDLDRLISNLSINSKEAGAKKVTITAQVQPGLLRLIVADDGPGGLGKDLRPLGKSRSSGNGLGLEIVRELLNKGQASLTVDSAPQHGTKISMEFSPQ